MSASDWSIQIPLSNCGEKNCFNLLLTKELINIKNAITLS